MTTSSFQVKHEVQQVPWQVQAAQALSKRQWEVVQFLPQGLANHEIGNKLFLSEDTIKTHIRQAGPVLWKFASYAGVTQQSRTSLGVISLRCGKSKALLQPTGWAHSMMATLSSFELTVLQRIAETNASVVQVAEEMGIAHIKRHLEAMQERLWPFTREAKITPNSATNMAAMLVRAGTIRTPEMKQRWRESVTACLSEREREVLAFVVRGLDNPSIGDELALSPLTIKSHMARIVAKLKLYGPGIGVIHPTRRSGLATIGALALL